MSKELRVLIVNRLGLHARAAARLVNLANQFKSAITVTRTDSGNSADGKSILSVIFLAAPMGTELSITASGEDEAAAVHALAKLVWDKFGEETDVY